jgi:hypothetical protein
MNKNRFKASVENIGQWRLVRLFVIWIFKKGKTTFVVLQLYGVVIKDICLIHNEINASSH